MNAHFYGPLPQALQALAAISPAWAARLPELQSALLPALGQGFTAAAGLELPGGSLPLVLFSAGRVLFFALAEGDDPAAAAAVGDRLWSATRPLAFFHRASEGKKLLCHVLLAGSHKAEYLNHEVQFTSLQDLPKRLAMMRLSPEAGLADWLSTPLRPDGGVLAEQADESLRRWVTFVMDGWLKDAKAELDRLRQLGYAAYLTNSYANAKTYCRTRFPGPGARYGFLTSSDAENMLVYGAMKGVRTISRIPRPEDEGWEERFFDPAAPDGCQTFRRAGLETMLCGRRLELAVLGWGDDLHWSGRWKSRHAPFTGLSFGKGADRPPRTEIPDGRMIRSPINKRRAAYETLLSAGKQGLIVFIDRNPYIYFDHTYNALIRAGLKKAF